MEESIIYIFALEKQFLMSNLILTWMLNSYFPSKFWNERTRLPGKWSEVSPIFWTRDFPIL